MKPLQRYTLALVALLVALIPVSADAGPKYEHHDKPAVQRVIDWD